MRFSNEDVIKYSLDPSYTNVVKSFTGRLQRLGTFVYSYNEIIANVHNPNNIIIYGKTAKYDDYFSHTTSRHVNLFINYCDENNIYYTIFCPYKKKHISDFAILPFTCLDPQECPITLETYTDGYRTNCGHEFSTKALNKWLKNKYTCPLCRHSLIH